MKIETVEAFLALEKYAIKYFFSQRDLAFPQIKELSFRSQVASLRWRRKVCFILEETKGRYEVYSVFCDTELY